jgi:DNA-binding beta-propeller fold protein YncE
MWPLPPELPRYLYEGSLRNAGSVRDESPGSQMFRSLTGVNNDGASFGKPLAVAARNGRVYVTDTEGRRVFVFDLRRRRTFSFGLRFEGELKKPAGIATDASGLVYVVDSTARRVVVFDALGLYVSSIDGTRDWVRPSAIAVTPDGQRIHVLDTGGVESNTHCVWTYAHDGRALGALGRRGREPAEFNLPTDLTVGPDGALWVLDAGNFRVQAFDAERRFVRQFGSLGTSVGQLARPRGIAVDRDGLVYVSDATFCNVQVFQPDGQLLLTIGSRADRDAPGRYLLPARLACDETGRLYVVDQFLHKVEVLRRLSDAEGHRLQQVSVG